MIGTCSHCGKENIELHQGLCNKHYRQLKENGYFLDNNQRSKLDPNEFIYDQYLNCYHMKLYDNLGTPIREALISIEDYERCKNIKWRMKGKSSCIGTTSKGRVSLGRFILGLSNDDERLAINKNGDFFDCRRDNLFVGTRYMQAIIFSYRKDNEFGLPGVNEKRGKYEVMITNEGKQMFLGSFEKLEDAIYTRRMAEWYLGYNKILQMTDMIFPLDYILPEGYELDPNRRTKYSPNEFIFGEDKDGKYCQIVLFDSKNRPVAKAIIDADDYERCKDIKWFLRDKAGYVGGCINGKIVFLHRYIKNPPDDKIIDHFDRNPLNNRKLNLIITDQRSNLINRHMDKQDRDLPPGVTEENGKYRARFYKDGKNISLGTFDNKMDAIVIRKQEEYKYGYHNKKKSPLLYIPNNIK